MSVVDTDRDPSTGQRVAWGNTRRLPLAKLSFSYDGVLEPDTPLHTATFLARVTTTYEIAGYDTSPVQVDDGFSFVKVHGTWRLAGVSDADDQFAKTALPVPWDGAPIDTYGDGHYLAVVDRGKKALARRIVALCRRGNREDQTLLGIENTRPTVVLATTQSSGFGKFSGPDALAVTYPLSGPDGVTPGWRVTVNPRDVHPGRRQLGRAAARADPPCHPELPGRLAALAGRRLGRVRRLALAWRAGDGDAGTRLRAEAPRPGPAAGQRDVLRPRGHPVRLRRRDGVGHLARGAPRARAVVSLMRAYDDAGGYDVSFDPDTATPGILSKVLGISPAALATAAYAEMETDVPKA